ncbi:MAG: outer membrane beta-barrel protein [Methanosarcinales archaeon]|nr:outer membrane beta-barrel protein [Methanosarcinales archaeon]
MKTINKLYLSLILLSSSLSAVDKSYSFLGIQTGSSFVEGQALATIGLKYGIQTKKYRTAISYNYAQKSNLNYQTLIAQIDTGVLTNQFKKSSFKPYAGLSFGVIKEKNKLTTSVDKGYVYGINTGFAYIFSDALDVDLGYRYLKTSKLKSIASLNDLSLSMHYFY